jgi:hypothetical protein
MSKSVMTLNLSDAERQAIEDLCAKKNLSKTALLKQCLRLYQAIDARLESGEKFFFEDENKNKSEVLML